jgi:hypothetical protein
MRRFTTHESRIPTNISRCAIMMMCQVVRRRSNRLVTWPWVLVALVNVQQSCSFTHSTAADVSHLRQQRRQRRACQPAGTATPGGQQYSLLDDCHYLSDLPTPALLVDVDAARLIIADEASKTAQAEAVTLGSLLSRANGDEKNAQLLHSTFSCPWVQLSAQQALVPGMPVSSSSGEKRGIWQEGKTPREPLIVREELWNQPQHQRQLYYLHSRVVRGRQKDLTGGRGRRPGVYLDGNGDKEEENTAVAKTSTFLCELDLPEASQLDPSAHAGSHRQDGKEEAYTSMGVNGPVGELVLGLNNHHVGSYYWARSAGSGAAMEAPGIELWGGNVLRWKDPQFELCNSNDGKRSEWVNFLRPGDQVQLVPTSYALMAHIMYYATENRIYGVSQRGRPLGSEPIVVCRYELRNVPPRERV